MYVDAPRYLLRKFCALKLLKDVPRGEVLEIGCGAGSFSAVLVRRGFKVKAIDTSSAAVELCRERLNGSIEAGDLSVELKDFQEVKGTFDGVFMFEVLEHLEFDRAAVKDIHSMIHDGGHLFISVPANQAWFGPFDAFVGHYRRYDRQDLLRLLFEEGFQVERCWSYGVPLANVTEWIRNRIYRSRSVESMEEGTRQSGIRRDIEYRFRYFLNDFFMFPFYLLQMLFTGRDWGTGLIVRARKVAKRNH
ncbi:MAG TPA: class I SAM-dependent methyltransferase [Acidobacteriota bacterium]|nr:class I SAM-dependent methyltransferase [Acidobacteriota bacterium]